MHTILVVDDAKDTLMLLEFDLAEEGYKVITAECGEDALETVKSQKVDLILLDMYMPGLSGLSTLEKLKQNNDTLNLPVIMLSASQDEDEIVAALEMGADDYVTKPYIAKVLLARIRTSLRLMVKTQELEKLASTDFLTGLNNRGSFEEIAVTMINQSSRSHQELVMCMCDIDFFKNVNDTYGHEAGDKVLVEFSNTLVNFCRDYDAVGRIGGEEFAICMPNISVDNAKVVAERLRELIESQQVDVGNDQKISITVSIGLSSANGFSIGLADLMRKADEGLYHAKSTGRNRVVYLEEKSESIGTGVDLDDLNQELLSTDHLNMELSSSTETVERADYQGIDYDIGVANVLGDDKLFSEILKMFYEDHHLDAHNLKQAFEVTDELSAKHIAHTLKGVACSIGAMDLFEATKALDSAINHQKTDRYMTLYHSVNTELTKVIASIKDKLITL